MDPLKYRYVYNIMTYMSRRIERGWLAGLANRARRERREEWHLPNWSPAAFEPRKSPPTVVLAGIIKIQISLKNNA